MKTKSFIFSNNRSVIDSSITSHTKICKKYVALSFYYIREAIATKINRYYFIPRETNPLNILSKD